MNDLLAAMRCVNDIDAIQAIGSADARTVTAQLKKQSLAAYKGKRKNVNPRQMIVQGLRAQLQDGMLAAYMLGKKRSEMFAEGNTKAIPLSLSVYASALRILKKRIEIPSGDLSKLQSKIKSTALKVLNDVSDNVEEKLRDTVGGLLEEGAHVKEATQTLDEAFDALGLTKKNNFQLETVFRTQTALTFSAGRWQADQDEAIQEILWGYKYVTVGDDRVRPEHEELDGVTLPKDDPFWDTFWPPNGWNCRCQAIPIFEERKEVQSPDDAEVDPDFAFNAGDVF